MRNNINDFFDDAETEIVQVSNVLAKVTFAPKYIPYKTLSKFELAHFLYLN
jgi:hypothetical protein